MGYVASRSHIVWRLRTNKFKNGSDKYIIIPMFMKQRKENVFDDVL